VKHVILNVVLYRYENWPLALTEENRLKMFNDKVLRGIFGTKIKENGDK
jgi:hypothetical protein